MLKLFQLLQEKVQQTDFKLSQKLEQRLNQPYSSSVFYFGVIRLNINLVLWQIILDVLKFFIILLADPGDSFNLFFRQRELRSCPFSYSVYKRMQVRIRMFSLAGVMAMIAVAVVSSLVTNFLFGGKEPSLAATYGWVQSSWSGGADAVSTASHDLNQAAWNKYQSKDSLLSAVDTLKLANTASVKSQTTDTDFSPGTKTNVVINGTGTAASVKMASYGAANTWYTLAGLPGLSLFHGGAHDGNGHIFTNQGFRGDAVTNLFYKYDIATNAWTQVANLPGQSNHAGMVYGGNGYIYANQGWDVNNTNYNAFWRYDIAANSWSSMANMPDKSALGALAWDGADTIYAKQGANSNGWGPGTNVFWKYTISANTWGVLAAMPSASTDSGLVFCNGSVYTSVGRDNGVGFWRYNIGLNSWSSVANMPGASNANSNAMVCVANKIYMTQSDSDGGMGGGATNLFWQYDTVANSWSTLANTPETAQGGNFLVGDGNGNLYGDVGYASAGFYRYSISNNTTATYLSAASDTGQASVFSTLGFSANVPASTTLSVDIRAGNSDTPDGTWTGWQTDVQSGGDISGLTGKRYFQYRVNMSAASAASFPQLSSIDVNYSFYHLVDSHDVSLDLLEYASDAEVQSAYASNGASSFNSQYPPAYSYTYVKTTTEYPAYDMAGYNATNPAKSLVGGYSSNGWMATDYSPQRFHIDLGSAKPISRIYLENHHNSGGENGRGAKDFTFWGSNSASDFTDTVYANNGTWTQLTTSAGQFAQHSAANQSDPQYVTVSNSTPYRYYAFKFVIAWTPGGDYMGVRRVELQAAALQAYAESTIKTQGTYALKGVALATTSLNKTLTRTLGSPVNLAGLNLLHFDLRAARTGGNLKIGIHDAGGVMTEITPNVTVANDWQTINWDLSGVADADKDAVDRIVITIVNADADNTFYLDNMQNTPQVLISSPYDTGSQANILSKLMWTESLPARTDIKFQVRSSANGSAWSGWMGVDGSNGSFFTAPDGSEAIPSALADGVNDQWLQYKAFLSTADTSVTPALSGVNIKYVVNARPEFNPDFPAAAAGGVAAAQDTGGLVQINFSVRDPDSSGGIATPNLVTPSFYYSIDDGQSYSQITTGLSAGATSPKTVEETNYLNYSVTWNAAAQLGNAVNVASATVRVLVTDNEPGPNTAQKDSATFSLNTMVPVLGLVPIKIDASVVPAIVTLDATDATSLEMKVSTDPTLSDVNWVSYTATTTIVLPANPSTVYFQVKNANNFTSAIFSATTPEIPSAVMVQDTSNLNFIPSEFRLFTAWKVVADPSPGFASYEVYRSTDQSNWSLISTVNSRQTNYYGDNSVGSSTDYYYRVRTSDSDGNISAFSAAVNGKANGIQDAGEGGGGTLAPVPPVISNIATSSIFTTQAAISWETDKLSDSLVYFQTVPGCDFSAATSSGIATMVNNASGYGVHRVILTGLLPNTTYYFLPRSTDANGISGQADCSGDGLSFTTADGPSITSGSVHYTNISNTMADIVWTTDQPADSYVDFATSTNAGNLVGSVELGSSNLVADHRVTLFGLAPGTTYYFNVKSGNTRDSNGNAGYYSFQTTRDLTLPTISGIVAQPAYSLASIRFVTAKPATSTVTIEAGAESYTTTIDTLNTNHNFDFSGLTAATVYTVSIVARDVNGNLATSAGTTFETLPAPDSIAPVISTSSDFIVTSQTGAAISWTTDEPATGYVEYATTSATSTFESSYQQVGRSDFTAGHVVSLEGLTPKTTYYFRIRSVDASGNATVNPVAPAMWSFDTVVQPLAISGVATSTVTNNQAVIVWSTNHQADSNIIYGTESGSYALSRSNAAQTSEHAMAISGLSSSTVYYYRVISSDTLGQAATSSEYSFTTSQQPISQAEYQSKLDQISSLLAQINSLQLQASSTEQANSGQVSLLQGQLAVLQAQVADLQQQLAAAGHGGGGGVLIVDNTQQTDKTLPRITDIKTGEVKDGSIEVSWVTDESASSFIRYGTTTAYGEFSGYSDLLTSHHFQLKHLDNNSKYHYRIESADASGNLAVSPDRSFQTPSLEARLKDEGKSDAEIAKLVEQAASKEESKTNILLAAASKAMEIMSQVASQVSLGTLETTLLTQFDNIERLAGSIPGPILGGEPLVVTGASTANISWVTDKKANSLVAYAPDGVYIKTEDDKGYLQVVGDANNLVSDHAVRIAGLRSNTVYHYQLRSKALLGPEAKSRDFTFKTKEEGLEVLTYGSEIKDPSAAIFRWSTNLEADTKLVVTPYRSGKLSIDETKIEENKVATTMHELEAKDLESGVVYEVRLQSKDAKNRLAEEVIGQFTTSKDDLPPQITNVQTESALSQGRQLKVQTIISWQTNEPTIDQVSYVEGVVTDDREFPDKTSQETTYSRKHVAVVTKFDPGQVYTFRISATDSSGNKTVSQVYTILTPKQKESVFQLILKNFEDIFGWVGRMGN